MKIKKKHFILAVVACFIVAIDQLTKMYIHTHFELGEYVPVFPDFFNITYVRNPGAAFGFLSTSHETFRTIFFLSMPPVALITILYILKTVAENDTFQILALSGIFGGAIGNYIDRIRFSYVIDFLDFHWKNKYSFPAFNIADSAIVCGVFALMFLMKTPPAEEKK